MDLSLSSILAGIVFGVSGLYIFRAGKRRADVRWIFLGLALMLYSYFVPGPWLPWAVGAALMGLVYYWR